MKLKGKISYMLLFMLSTSALMLLFSSRPNANSSEVNKFFCFQQHRDIVGCTREEGTK